MTTNNTDDDSTAALLAANEVMLPLTEEIDDHDVTQPTAASGSGYDDNNILVRNVAIPEAAEEEKDNGAVEENRSSEGAVDQIGDPCAEIEQAGGGATVERGDEDVPLSFPQKVSYLRCSLTPCRDRFFVVQ